MKNAGKQKKFKPFKWGIALVCLLVFIGVFYSGWLGGESEKKEENTQWREPVSTVPEVPDSVLATGIIKPCVGAEVRVGSRVSGIVEKLHVKIGDPVEKNQLLGQLEKTEFQAQCDQAQAALENARAERDYAALNLERLSALRKKEAISQDRLDIAQTTFDVAQSKVKQATASLDHSRIQLGYTWIRAPIKGVVAEVSTQEGETVAAGFTAPTFVVIIDLQRLEVWAYVDETDIGRINEGQQADFTVDTYPGVPFKGKVRAIYPKAEMKDNVVNYIAVIDIVGKEGYILRPEMTTTVHIYQGPAKAEAEPGKERM